MEEDLATWLTITYRPMVRMEIRLCGHQGSVREEQRKAAITALFHLEIKTRGGEIITKG